MIKKVILILIVFSSFACSNNSREGVLSNNDFVEILVDLHIYDSMYDVRSSVLNADNGSWELYTKVFEKHNCTIDDFKSSLKYYVNNPEEYNKVYDVVISKLQIMNDSLQVSKEKFKELILDKDALRK